ncbi:MAG: hypothetical protein KKF44_00675 [Nanoarchaeota archaeon]|nr:hypothetical protein [Nanoarchaeota archaeon]
MANEKNPIEEIRHIEAKTKKIAEDAIIKRDQKIVNAKAESLAQVKKEKARIDKDIGIDTEEKMKKVDEEEEKKLSEYKSLLRNRSKDENSRIKKAEEYITGKLDELIFE